ncbi:MAG: OsmC family peroxiredoxin [Thermoflexia bacterium]|nr:MAG: OsmC family peroxiredoxin [Thermoflexia bacterium]
MGFARVKWVEKFQFVGIDSTRHSVVLSSPDEENGIGMKPSDLLLVALGACTAYDVVNILTKKRQRITGLEVEVSGEQQPEPPWKFTRIHLTYRVRGRGLDEKAVQDAIELSKNRYCSVGASLSETTEVTYGYILEEEL